MQNAYPRKKTTKTNTEVASNHRLWHEPAPARTLSLFNVTAFQAVKAPHGSTRHVRYVQIARAHVVFLLRETSLLWSRSYLVMFDSNDAVGHSVWQLSTPPWWFVWVVEFVEWLRVMYVFQSWCIASGRLSATWAYTQTNLQLCMLLLLGPCEILYSIVSRMASGMQFFCLNWNFLNLAQVCSSQFWFCSGILFVLVCMRVPRSWCFVLGHWCVVRLRPWTVLFSILHICPGMQLNEFVFVFLVRSWPIGPAIGWVFLTVACSRHGYASMQACRSMHVFFCWNWGLFKCWLGSLVESEASYGMLWHVVASFRPIYTPKHTFRPCLSSFFWFEQILKKSKSEMSL